MDVRYYLILNLISIEYSIGIEKSLNIILNNSKKEFELANAISLRIVVANTNKAYIEIMIKEAKILLDMINNELIKY